MTTLIWWLAAHMPYFGIMHAIAGSSRACTAKIGLEFSRLGKRLMADGE